MRRSGKGLRGGPPREQIESRFAVILADLVARIPGARAAALVDNQGETVDYAGRLDAFSVRVAAAHMRIVLQDTAEQPWLAGQAASVAVRTSRGAFAVYALPEGYAIALLMSFKARLSGHVRAISAITQMLADEVGWRAPAIGQNTQWLAVDVLSDPAGSPRGLRVRGELQRLDALGRFSLGLGWRQRGWRVRFSGGVEAMLVREPGGFWYTDEPPTMPHPPERREEGDRAGPGRIHIRKTLTGRPT